MVLKSICPMGLCTAPICRMIAIPTPRRTQRLVKSPTEKMDREAARVLKACNHRKAARVVKAIVRA